MQANEEMRCFPPREPLWQWALAILAMVALFGGIIGTGLVIVSELVTNYQTPQQTKLVLIAVGLLLSLVLLVIFVRWQQDRWYWVLDNEKLIGGKKKDKVFPLSSITSIVLGLPDKTHFLVGLGKFTQPHLWHLIMTQRQTALLLKLEDGSLMPFDVHRCVNGSSLMTELVSRLAKHVDRDYKYSHREIKALQSADWNRVLRTLRSFA